MGSDNNTISRLFSDDEQDFGGDRKKTRLEDFAQKYEGFTLERGNTATFWCELLQIIQEKYANIEEIKNLNVFAETNFEEQVNDGSVKWVDAHIHCSKTLIEQKKSTVSLDEKIQQSDGEWLTPYEQALRYTRPMGNSEKPDFIVTSNFREIWVYDERTRESIARGPIKLKVSELEKDRNWEYLRVLLEPSEQHKEVIKREKLSQEAGIFVSKLRNKFWDLYQATYGNDWKWDDLNKLSVRLVFCAFAERCGLFGEDTFSHYLNRYLSDPSELGIRLQDLFEVLNTPENSRGLIVDELNNFPYVNGGLFKEKIKIPRFDTEAIFLLINEGCKKFDWSSINPAIFGSIFEGTLSVQDRREHGMHYTSEKNIKRVINPLFMDDLRDEFREANGKESKQERVQDLLYLRDKIGDLVFLDPACGSGNFLTVTYAELRALESDIMHELAKDELGVIAKWRRELPKDEYIEKLRSRIKLENFYGIEINGFACEVARTALWMAEVLANMRFKVGDQEVKYLPLNDMSKNIVNQNAIGYIDDDGYIRITDWGEIVDKDRLSYIIGNPPFSGSSNVGKETKLLLKSLYSKEKGTFGSLDLVCAWFYKAMRMVQETSIRVAFVSTSTISRGTQVSALWGVLLKRFRYEIDFCYQRFPWGNDETKRENNSANVNVIIIGFSANANQNHRKHYIYEVSREKRSDRRCLVDSINCYLTEGNSVIVEPRSTCLSNVPTCRRGVERHDGNWLLVNESTKGDFEEKYLRQMVGGSTLYSGKNRWCLWLKDYSYEELKSIPKIYQRLLNCAMYRSGSSRAGTLKYADFPHLFLTDWEDTGEGFYAYSALTLKTDPIPIVFVKGGIPEASIAVIDSTLSSKDYCILSSKVYTVWANILAQSMENGGKTLSIVQIYNTFIFLEPHDEAQKETFTRLQKELLSIYDNAESIDKLYKSNDPHWRSVLNEINDNVYKLYGFLHEDGSRFTDDEVFAGLLKLYQKRVEELEVKV